MTPLSTFPSCLFQDICPSHKTTIPDSRPKQQASLASKAKERRETAAGSLRSQEEASPKITVIILYYIHILYIYHKVVLRSII